jgi:hypothetical protein
MAMRTWACLAGMLAACSGQSNTAEPEPEEQPAAAAVEPAPSSGPEAELLAKGEAPPPLAANAKLLEMVAEHYGVGLVRCPLVGSGRVRQIYGTNRDQLTIFGPTWEMEWDPAEAPPWDPAFDEVVSEDDWVTLLAVPGQTRAWIATRTDTYAYEFPPAVAGETTLCTGVHPTKSRVVRGTVKGEMAEENLIVPCVRDLPAVASDNTFVMEVPTPCTLWVEGGPNRSEKLRVDEGEGPIDHEFTMARDPLLKENRFWSKEGNAKVEATLAAVEARHKQTTALLDKIAAAFPEDNLVQSNVKRHRYELSTRDHKINQTRIGMEEIRQGKIPVVERTEGAPRH